MHAIVTFRTLPNGAFRYTRGLKRGYWRVMIVTETRTAPRITDTSTLYVYETSAGLDGVTPRSNYYIGGNKRLCESVAARANMLISAYPCDANTSNACAIMRKALKLALTESGEE